MTNDDGNLKKLINDFQKILDANMPELPSEEARRKVYFDLAVKHFLYEHLNKDFFSYRFFNDSVLSVNENQLHLKFVIFSGESVPPVPEVFWITHEEIHYLCELDTEIEYQQMVLLLKISDESKTKLGEMPVFSFNQTVRILKKRETGHLDFIKDLFDQNTKTPELCTYYMNQVFGLRTSFDDLKGFLQKIDKREWEKKLQSRTEAQKHNQLDYFVPCDLDKKLMLTQEEVDLLLASVQ